MPLLSTDLKVPFFRVQLSEAEIDGVTECLKSGWLTSGPRASAFESQFADAVRAKHAVAVNSCTASLHLAVESLGLREKQAVLVPTMTFAATSEVIRYQNAVPILVDCDPLTLNMNLDDAEQKMKDVRQGKTPLCSDTPIVGIIVVHVGGLMMDMEAVERFAARHNLWVVEDAAHALPAAFRGGADRQWRRSGQNTADVTCFSFYANKTLTTGEGGMAVTDNLRLAERMRSMSLHGLTKDAWTRFSGRGNWDYQIVAPGYKYNLTDIAASLGIGQLQRAEQMRQEREVVAEFYLKSLQDLPQIELPPTPGDRLQSWHLFPIRLKLEELTVDRNTFKQELEDLGVGTSVHWRPLHLHPYYQENFGWEVDHLPVASEQWQRLISLPIFPGLRAEEMEHVVQVVRLLSETYSHRLRNGSPVATRSSRKATNSVVS